MTNINAVIPKEGWHALHQIYSICIGAWSLLDEEEQEERLNEFTSIIREVKTLQDYQVALFSVIGKADFGVMIIGPDLQKVDTYEKRLKHSLGPDVLTVDYSFLSLTEESEYKMSEEEYRQHLIRSESLDPNSPALEEKVQSFFESARKYSQERIYPQLMDWQTICFYPMAKRRNSEQNWYALDFNSRRDLMKGHGTIGRKYTGKVKQIITGAVGLSDWEWGVTLFANDISFFKDIIYEMRFDPVTYHYGEFGPFYIGLLMQEEELLERVILSTKSAIPV